MTGIRSMFMMALAVGGCSNMSMSPSTEPIDDVPAEALFVVNGGDSSISVIDTSTNSVAGTIAIKNAKFPHHIYKSADGARLLVAIPGMDLSGGHDSSGGTHDGAAPMGAVLLLDAGTGKTLASRQLDMMNHNAIFSPDGTEVWTSQMMAPGSVLVLDGTTLATRAEIAVGDMPAEVTFSRDGKYGFVANGMSNTVSVIAVADKKVVKTIAVGEDPVGPWPGVDGILYTDCEKGMSIYAIDPSTLSVVRTYDLGFMPGMVGTPAGAPGELWVTNSDDGKVVFNSTSADMKTGEVAVGAGAHGIAFSSDGTTAYVTNQMAASVSVIDVRTHAVIKTIAVGSKPNGLVTR